jgi:hypothetical protein
MISDERKFLHDLSGPFAMVFYLLDAMIEDLSENPLRDEQNLEQLKTVFKTLERMKSILDNRREILIQRDSNDGNSSSK